MKNLNKKYIYLDTYNALFPKDNVNYPCKKVESYIYIEKQCNKNLWGINYWRIKNSNTDYNKEYFTGFIKNNGSIVLVEDNPRPLQGSTGFFELEYISEKKYEVYYYGIGKGITFSTIGTVKKNK